MKIAQSAVKMHRELILAAVLGMTATLGAQELEPNKLTSAESTAGYDLLFNGTDLQNWHGYRMTAPSDGFKVRNTAPLGARIETGSGNTAPLLTNKKYKNFDLKVDIMTTANGNSGVFVRYQEVATSPLDTRSGPEMQVCGPNNGDCRTETRHFGSCYDMFGVRSAIRNTWYKTPGEWNQLRIIAYDSNYVHYGNGQKLLEYKIGTPEFMTAYRASKFFNDGNNGNYYDIHLGGFLLQHHGEQGMSFRNLKAKELTVHPFASEFPSRQWPDTLPQTFAFGATPSTGTRSPANTEPVISVRQGGAGLTLISLPKGHAHLHVVGMDGRAVPYRRISSDELSIQRGQGNSGIAVLRLHADGRSLTKMISLQ